MEYKIKSNEDIEEIVKRIRDEESVNFVKIFNRF